MGECRYMQRFSATEFLSLRSKNPLQFFASEMSERLWEDHRRPDIKPGRIYEVSINFREIEMKDPT